MTAPGGAEARDEGAEFAALAEALAGIFDVSALLDDDGGAARLTARSAGRLTAVWIACPPARLIRSPATLAQAPLEHFALCLASQGRVVALGDPAFACRAGAIFCLDLMQPIDLVAERGAELFVLFIDRARALDAFADEEALHGFSLAGPSATAQVLAAALGALAAQQAVAEDGEFAALAEGVLALAAAALAPALKARAAPAPGARTASLVTVRRYIDRHLASNDLGVAQLARKFALSRATLYRLFEPLGGVADYIREQRLRRAWREVTALELTDRRLGLIGWRLGFNNVNSFSRAFRQRFGMSPRAARALALGGAPLAVASTAADGPLAQRLRASARFDSGRV